MSLVEYAKEEILRVNVGNSKVMRCSRYGNGANACDTIGRTVRGSGLF